MLLEISNLYYSYPERTPLFKNLNLGIEAGKIIALAGESGCGKSTLLNLIYGRLNWESGDILFDGKKLLGPKGNLVPGESQMKLVAQDYDLMPYATVYDNVGKFISNINLQKKREKVLELLEVVGMEEFADVLPKNLSGGQQQRVAIARALSVTPKLLLLDEPFSNLDFSRKIKLRENLFNYVKKENLSLIISTHNIPEIMPWLDKIILLQDGRLIQNDGPRETYENPYNEYVARLFGEVNVFSDEEMKIWNLPKKYIYPDQITVSNQDTNTIEAEVLESRFSGSYFWNKLKINNKEIVVTTKNPLEHKVNLEFH